jgi:hypothetical protein
VSDTLTQTPSSASPQWLVITKPFHQFVEGEDESAKQAAINKLFEGLVGSEHNDAAVEALSSSDFVPDNDILVLFSSKPTALVRRAISEMRKLAAPAPEAVASVPTMRQGVSLLPQVPNDESFLELLKTGGVFKFGEAEAVSAVRVLMVQGLNLNGVEQRVLGLIEARAEELDEAVPQIFYDLDKASRRKTYADVLSALDISSQVVTEARRRKALESLGGLFDDLANVHQVVDGWNQSWVETMSNPGLMMTQIANAFSGGGGAGAMPTMLEAPDPGPVLASAESFRGGLNRSFSGTRIPVVRALAAEALATVQFLEKPSVISATGAGSKEELYKKLGLQVGADMVRAERAAVQYLLALLHIEKVDPQQLPVYISSLAQLGKTLPWGLLQGAASGTAQKTSPHQVRSQRGGGSPLDR